MKIGTLSETDVFVVYIEGLTNKRLVEEVSEGSLRSSLTISQKPAISSSSSKTTHGHRFPKS